MMEQVTDYNSRIDEDLIECLQNIVDELKEQNRLLNKQYGCT